MITYSPNRRRVLGLLGFIWVVSAYGIATTPPTNFHLPHELVPRWVQVLWWAVPGGLALFRAIRWRHSDAWAWGLLVLPISVYTFSFLFGYIIFLLPGNEGFSAGWRGAAVYAALGSLIFYCAKGLDRIPEPKEGGEKWGRKSGLQ